MPAKKRHIEPRLITPEAPWIPESFAVIDAYDAYDAAGQVCEIFENPAVSLVVWCHTSETVPETLKETVRTMTVLGDFRPRQACSQVVPSRWHSFFDDEPGEIPIRKHFAKVAGIVGRDDVSLRPWHENCLDVADDFTEAFGARSIDMQTQFRRNGDDRRGVQNNDDLRSHSIRAMRVLVGDTPHFYESEGGEPWTVRPWDFAFVRHNTLQQPPSPLCGYNAENRHVAEIYDIKSRYEFVTDAPRLWFKKWRRLPQPD